MQPTLLLPILISLFQLTIASSSPRDRFLSSTPRLLGSCQVGCLQCNPGNVCISCEDDLFLSGGACIEPYTFKNNLVYIKFDHALVINIDNASVDIPVCVIGAILALGLYVGAFMVSYKQEWSTLVPEPPKDQVKANGEPGRGSVKGGAQNGTPKADKSIELVPGSKSNIPDSPAKLTSPGKNSSPAKSVRDDENPSPQKKYADDDDEEEEVYYPSQKEMAHQHRKPQRKIQEEDEEEEEGEEEDQVDIQVHDDGEDQEEDENKTAQETPSPKAIYASPKLKGKVGARRDSNHSDGDYEEHHRNPAQRTSHNRQNEEEEEDEEEFESARSSHGRNGQHKDSQDEEEEDQEGEEEGEGEEEEEEGEGEEEEDEEPQQVMNLDDIR